MNKGLSDVWGSWNTKPIFFPLAFWIISSLLHISSLSIFIDPSVISPGGSIKFIIAFAIVDFPEPDSPTIPSISPLTPSSIPYNEMTPEDIVEMDWEGKFIGKQPSSDYL